MRLSIADHLFTVLKNDCRVKSYVGDNIYPVATRVEKSFPLILVERDTAVSYYTKDSASTVETEATVFVVTEDYNSGKTIAEAVINALDRKEATYTGFAVLDCTHIGAVEGYQDQSFVQQIQFHFITSIK